MLYSDEASAAHEWEQTGHHVFIRCILSRVSGRCCQPRLQTGRQAVRPALHSPRAAGQRWGPGQLYIGPLNVVTLSCLQNARTGGGIKSPQDELGVSVSRPELPVQGPPTSSLSSSHGQPGRLQAYFWKEPCAWTEQDGIGALACPAPLRSAGSRPLRGQHRLSRSADGLLLYVSIKNDLKTNSLFLNKCTLVNKIKVHHV